MKRLVVAAAALVAALGLAGQTARAQGLFPLYRSDPQLAVSGLAVGAATTGAYFAVRNAGGGPRRIPVGGAWGLTTVGCMALTPLIGGIVVQRELTRREVHMMLADCIVPFIGGWIMDAYFRAHPERDSVPPPPPVRRVAYRHKH